MSYWHNSRLFAWKCDTIEEFMSQCYLCKFCWHVQVMTNFSVFLLTYIFYTCMYIKFSSRVGWPSRLNNGLAIVTDFIEFNYLLAPTFAALIPALACAAACRSSIIINNIKNRPCWESNLHAEPTCTQSSPSVLKSNALSTRPPRQLSRLGGTNRVTNWVTYRQALVSS